ncbi:VQ motif-containing protein 11 [Beta vulgaris subsp. vulgaris]|uniref:VQ motif-containing protein 11 n=1 Tax=Beta vulgaris subsp. vulgaris TaxID=3555 RepID=UPI0020376370|nr:VQ motif-containing protein 11 [Beta vulgaris subsp. vulgaris]
MSTNSTNTTKQQSMHHISSYHETSSLTTNNTTFVQANPSNFRAIVQHLTGSRSKSGTAKQPVLDVDNTATAAFKLHERRLQQSQGGIKKLDMIKLNDNSPRYHGPINGLIRARGGNEVAMVSPVSTLDGLGLGVGSPSPRNGPRSRSSMSEEEERVVIAEKGFYLHPVSPLSCNLRDNEPQLLPLFPLHSPRDNQD